MTSSDGLENKPLAWWLNQLSPRQIWGLLGAFFIVIAGALSIGIWFGTTLLSADNTSRVVSNPVVQKASPSETLPEDLTNFDVNLLRILSEPHVGPVSPEYMAYRLEASPLRVEVALGKLAKKQLLILIKTEYGDIDSSVISPEGLEFMSEYELFE